MLSQFFSQLGSTESLILVMLLLIAFLLGTLLSYLLNGNKLKELREQLKQSEATRHQLAGELSHAKEERELIEQTLAEANSRIEERAEKLEEFKGKYGKLADRFKLMFETLNQANSSIRSYLSTIEDLNVQLKAEPASATDPIAEEGSETKAEADPAPVAGNGKSGSVLQRILKVEHQLHSLEQLNKQIAEQVSRIGKAPVGPGEANEASTGEPEADSGTAEEPALATAAYGLEPADDLIRIKGIGPVLQKKLQDLGINTFQQIAAFDHKLIEQLTRELDYFPGRIEEDDWVGQAKELLREKRAPGTGLEPSNDLTLFVGISPTVQEELRKQGINSWKELSEASVQDLQDMIKEAELDLDDTLVNTWPTQARFAETNQWELLEEYRQRIENKVSP